MDAKWSFNRALQSHKEMSMLQLKSASFEEHSQLDRHVLQISILPLHVMSLKPRRVWGAVQLLD